MKKSLTWWKLIGWGEGDVRVNNGLLLPRNVPRNNLSHENFNPPIGHERQGDKRNQASQWVSIRMRNQMR